MDKARAPDRTILSSDAKSVHRCPASLLNSARPANGGAGDFCFSFMPPRSRSKGSKRSNKKTAATTGGQQELPAEAAEPAESIGERLSRWWHKGVHDRSLNAIYGAFLLVPAWVLTRTFFGLLSHAAAKGPFWTGEECWFFSLGAVLWLLWFLGSFRALGGPRPLRLYVFGHELTHAIWVWLWGGKVYDKQWWSRDGGYIVTDTHNFWIALAPYFYPLYSLVVVLAFGLGSLFYDLTNSTVTFLMMTPGQWLFLLLGATWSFHLTFTIWMIPKGQTDLSSNGTFFSLVIIYLMNVILLSVFLAVAVPELSLFMLARELFHHAEDFSETICNGVKVYFTAP